LPAGYAWSNPVLLAFRYSHGPTSMIQTLCVATSDLVSHLAIVLVV
jgi:hypothetical protein